MGWEAGCRWSCRTGHQRLLFPSLFSTRDTVISFIVSIVFLLYFLFYILGGFLFLFSFLFRSARVPIKQHLRSIDCRHVHVLYEKYCITSLTTLPSIHSCLISMTVSGGDLSTPFRVFLICCQLRNIIQGPILMLCDIVRLHSGWYLYQKTAQNTTFEEVSRPWLCKCPKPIADS